MNEDDLIEYLMSQGALYWDGMTSEGEPAIRMNAERLKEIAPEIYEAMMKDIEDNLLKLYQVGLVDVVYDEDLSPSFKISNEAYEELEKKGFYHTDGV
jgi:hypothetical protein